jgi:hypothetical protein
MQERSVTVDRWSPLAGRLVDGQRSPGYPATTAHSGQRPAVAHWPPGHLGVEVFFWFFKVFFWILLFFYFFKALACSKGLDFLGKLGVQHPIF